MLQKAFTRPWSDTGRANCLATRCATRTHSRYYSLPLLALCCLLQAAASVRAANGIIGSPFDGAASTSTLEDIISSGINFANNKIEANKQIDDARQRFFKVYPSGNGLKKQGKISLNCCGQRIYTTCQCMHMKA